MPDIHPTACVEDGAILAEDVVVGPFSFVGREVELGSGVEVAAHVTLLGQTRIGAGCRIFPHACLGGEPQDRAFNGESTSLEIGARTQIREHVTVHVGTARGGGCTRIGEDAYLMNSAHIGHDCRVGDHAIIASFCGLGGHAQVGDHAVLGAYTGLHQHARVGESVMVAGGSKLSLDAPPFSMVAGDRARLVGLNTVGLRRRGFSRETRAQIKHAFHLIFHSKLRLEEALARVDEEMGGVPEVERLVTFLRKTERGFCR
ncbi:MAG: acyl-ACP--UDP-N-acetylglucosamine O-acyltransferase [Spirochaetaceae bacterium]|nr:acyl-ACP--UDP-N-acetylglucosamine O-acyltransferase [Myxococcales bacterium]MCB9723491.1 acyl-ACP--UDP-N-acetylglucosamine O-acyltransferase [Spirochaetaceae bacterium]